MINLLFDVDDTLYDQLIPFKDAYKTVFNKYNFNCPIELLFIRSRHFSDEVFELVNEGKMDKHDMHIYRISRAFQSLGIQITREDAESFQSFYEENQGKIVLHPQMIRILDIAVALDIRLGVITNGPSEHQAKKIEQLNLSHWVNEKDIFISGTLGISKPDRKIFKYIENTMNISPKDTYYFGDSFSNDVVGAKNSGWHAIWVNRRKHVIPSNTVYYPDYIINETNSPIEVLRNLFVKHNITHPLLQSINSL